MHPCFIVDLALTWSSLLSGPSGGLCLAREVGRSLSSCRFVHSHLDPSHRDLLVLREGRCVLRIGSANDDYLDVAVATDRVNGDPLNATPLHLHSRTLTNSWTHPPLQTSRRPRKIYPTMEALEQTLRSLLQPITHNLPKPLSDTAATLLGDSCYRSLVHNINISDAACMKLAVSKALGIAIVGQAQW